MANCWPKATPVRASPLVEYSVGRGRVIFVGWRLPDFTTAGDPYRPNLERLFRNLLGYLAQGNTNRARMVRPRENRSTRGSWACPSSAQRSPSRSTRRRSPAKSRPRFSQRNLAGASGRWRDGPRGAAGRQIAVYRGVGRDARPPPTAGVAVRRSAEDGAGRPGLARQGTNQRTASDPAAGQAGAGAFASAANAPRRSERPAGPVALHGAR